MKLHVLGAAHTVTGSEYLLEVNGHRLLLECGLFQGRRSDTFEKNLHFGYNPKTVDAMILSHAHIDHSGNLPNLVKNGFNAPIYATPATVELADIMLQDSARIQEMDVAFVNKKRSQRRELLVEPLYTMQDAIDVRPLFVKKNYNEAFTPIPGVRAHLVDAGHILGSASVCLDVEENGRSYRFWFSGDIGRYHLPLLKDPTMPQDVDYLLMESTYGDKVHGDPDAAFREFRDVVKRTVARGGKVIVPAFAVGRTQELVYALNRMITSGELPAIPVFVDSPLAVRATDVFKEFADDFDEETRNFVLSGKHPALSFKTLTYIQSVDESKALNERSDPMVIISASGMAEAGRILHHLRNNIENPRNTIAIVSWQAPDTLGRRLADREPHVRIFGEKFTRRAEVATIGGLSAHADQTLLMRYAQASNGRLKKLVVVHGEPRSSGALIEKLRPALPETEIIYPIQDEMVDI